MNTGFYNNLKNAIQVVIMYLQMSQTSDLSIIYTILYLLIVGRLSVAKYKKSLKSKDIIIKTST